MLQDILEKNKDYFKCIEIKNGYLTMTISLKDKWGVFSTPDGKISVGKSPSNIPNEYVYFGKYEEVTADEMFSLLEQTVKVNIEAELKYQLLNEKYDELKKVFATTPYEQLKSLYFAFSEPINVLKEELPKKKRKYVRKEKNVEMEDVKVEVENEVNEDVEHENVEVVEND